MAPTTSTSSPCRAANGGSVDGDRHRLPEGRSVRGQYLPRSTTAQLRAGTTPELGQRAVPLQTDGFVGQAEVGPAPAAPDAAAARNAARGSHEIARAEAGDILAHADDRAETRVLGSAHRRVPSSSARVPRTGSGRERTRGHRCRRCPQPPTRTSSSSSASSGSNHLFDPQVAGAAVGQLLSRPGDQPRRHQRKLYSHMIVIAPPTLRTEAADCQHSYKVNVARLAAELLLVQRR